MTTLREALTEKLSQDELALVKTAYDIVGDIAIIEIDEHLRNKEKTIADTILDLHKNIKVVCRKEGMHEGEFRTQKMKVVAGEKRLVTEHHENNCRFLVDVEKVYFSPRLSTERKRISDLIKKGERVLVMFSGAGPYPIVISRNSEASQIVAVEKNPAGHAYAIKNIAFNKTSNVIAYQGDAREVVPSLGTFDRVLMPLPKGGEDFLDIAIDAAKKGGIVHFYDFLHLNDFKLARLKAMKACRLKQRAFRSLHFRKCGQSAPRFFRVVLDFRVV